MKEILFSSLFLLCTACTPSTIIEPETPPLQVVDLGFAPQEIIKQDFTPYFDQRTLVFEADDGQFYTFQMTTPVVTENYRFRDFFTHPTITNKEVEYLYTGERVSFEWTSSELGARLAVLMQPAFCGDPMLETVDALQEHLEVIGTGFNLGDVELNKTVLDLNLSEQTICGEGRYIGTISFGERTFEGVRYAKQYLGDRFLEVYYSSEKGIVAFGTGYLFAVLDQAY